MNTSPQAYEETPRFRAAFERLLPEIRALPASVLQPINLDVPTAVATALGVVPKVRALRPQIAKGVGADYDFRLLDGLEDYARALGYAQSAYLAASSPPRTPEDLEEEATALRALLLSDTGALATRRLIDPDRLHEIQSRAGRRNVAMDLMALVSLLRANWPRVEGRTAVTLLELEQAELLADRLFTAARQRDQTPTLGAASSDRAAAFTLFLRSYNEVRRLVTYLRWHEDDVDEIVPSLYARRQWRTPDDMMSPDYDDMNSPPRSVHSV